MQPTNRTVSCNQAPVIGRLKRPIKSTQLNPPITKLIKITIATTTHPGKKNVNWGISKMEEFLTLDIVFTRDVCPKCIFFPEIVTVNNL